MRLPAGARVEVVTTSSLALGAPTRDQGDHDAGDDDDADGGGGDDDDDDDDDSDGGKRGDDDDDGKGKGKGGRYYSNNGPTEGALDFLW